jgi:hypothetical protein
MTYGNTDSVGHRASENVVTPNDYQATVLRLFGMDHKNLNFMQNGLPQKLVVKDKSRVLTEIIA